MVFLAAVLCSGRTLAPKPDVEVYVADSVTVPAAILTCAMQRAEKVFSDGDIAVRFRGGAPPAGTNARQVTIHILHESAIAEPRALAYAFPFADPRIDVMYDRVRTRSFRQTSARLGYVLVHEIVHVLQGKAVHTREGIMKALWTRADEFLIERGDLRLSAEDVEDIRPGMAAHQ